MLFFFFTCSEPIKLTKNCYYYYYEFHAFQIISWAFCIIIKTKHTPLFWLLSEQFNHKPLIAFHLSIHHSVNIQHAENNVCLIEPFIHWTFPIPNPSTKLILETQMNCGSAKYLDLEKKTFLLIFMWYIFAGKVQFSTNACLRLEFVPYSNHLNNRRSYFANRACIRVWL